MEFSVFFSFSLSRLLIFVWEAVSVQKLHPFSFSLFLCCEILFWTCQTDIYPIHIHFDDYFFPANRFTLEEINGSGAIIIVGAYKQETRIELDDHFTELFAIRLCQCLEIVMIDHKINWNLSRWNEIYYENHENRRTNNIFNVWASK